MGDLRENEAIYQHAKFPCELTKCLRRWRSETTRDLTFGRSFKNRAKPVSGQRRRDLYIQWILTNLRENVGCMYHLLFQRVFTKFICIASRM